MGNPDYEPDEYEEQILDFMRDEPGGRVTNRHVRKQLDFPAERVDNSLNNLRKAGWVKRITRGFYEFRTDPRQ